MAAKNGHNEVVKLLLAQTGVNPNHGAEASGKNCRRTPLSFAAGYGHKEVVELLLSRADVKPDYSALGNQYGGSGRTPLSYAAEYGHTSIVKIYY
jgi:ankyrin repeat protein